MTQTRFILLFMALSCMNVTYLLAEPDLHTDEKTAAYLKNFRSVYTKSMLEKKPELLLTYYAEEVRLMPVFQKTIMGKASALTYYTAFGARFNITAYARKETEILDLGKRVVEHGIFTMNLTLKSMGTAYEVKGKYLQIWEKLENGKLSLHTEAWNYDYPLPIEEQFRFQQVPTVDIALAAHLPINSSISFELAALNRLMEHTVTQHDAHIWSQFYSDDAILFSQRLPVLEGRKAIDQYLEKHVKELPVFEKLDIRNDRIDDLGDYVIEYASHIANWRNGESSGIGLGKDLRIWKREKNGSLKIFRHIGMYD